MNNPAADLYRVRTGDVAKTGAMLARAFRPDPVWQAVFGSDSTDAQREAVFSMPVRYCLRYGEAYAASENLEGIIGWTPGERAEMTIGRIIRCGGIVSGLCIGAELSRRIDSVFRQLTKDQNEHMREGRFLYVHILGVEPECQGRGIGRRLIGALLERAGRERRSVYLETETERNVEMYRRHGFRLVKTPTLEPIGLPMYEMIRDPA
jgi:ribosomal protein S18 acetylase RimI-like enzyme